MSQKTNKNKNVCGLSVLSRIYNLFSMKGYYANVMYISLISLQ